MRKKQFNRPITFITNSTQFNHLKEVTDEREIGISEYLRELIDEKIEQQDSK